MHSWQNSDMHKPRPKSHTLRLLLLLICKGTLVSVHAETYEPPRTSWGVPDMQGVWDFRTLTPMERPLEFGEKAVLTSAEAEALLTKILPPDRKDEPTGVPLQDVEGYNSFWLDAGENLDSEMRTSLIIDPPNGRLPERIASADERRLAQNIKRKPPVRDILSYSVGPEYLHEHPESLGLSERCLIGFNAGPPIIPSAYNNNLRIVQSPDHFLMVTEMVHDARIVPTSGQPQLPGGVRQWLGSSRGSWEDQTFVVETANFTDKTPAFQLPIVDVSAVDGVLGSGLDLHLVERFTHISDDLLSYEATVTAPESFKHPFTYRVLMRRSNEKIFEYACHEGNYAMGGILRGARLREQEVSAGLD